MNKINYDELIICPECTHLFSQHGGEGCCMHVPSTDPDYEIMTCACEHTAVELMDLYIQRLTIENADLRSKGDRLADTLEEGIEIVKLQGAEIASLLAALDMDRCPGCGEEMEDSYIKDDLVDGVVASVIRLNCLSCGFTTVISEPHDKEQNNG